MVTQCLLVFLCITVIVTLADEHWHQYKSLHGKKYDNKTEAIRKSIFDLSKKRVLSHNEEAGQGIHSYNLSLNHLADVPINKYMTRTLTGLLRSQHLKSELLDRLEAKEPIPETLDWREKGFKTPGWSQKECGSCYAFTMASAVEAQLFKLNGTLEEMSQQQIVDCSTIYGNLGCQGGSFRNTAKYLQRHGVLPSSKYPPYQAKQSICRAIRPKEAHKVKRWAVLPLRDETALKVAVAKIGPVAVSVDASLYTFQLYHSGVYDDPQCTGENLNHAMLVVGYTHDAWILKNWWSTSWGQGGYMKLKRGKNRCGIANYAVYVTLD